MIKLLAFDLDGTILLNHKEIPKPNLDALEKAFQKGVHIVPTTGRMKTFIPNYITELSFVQYAITANGGGVYDIRTGERLYKALIETKQAAEIVKIIKKYDLYCEYYLNGEAFTIRNDVDTAMKHHGIPETKRFFLSKKYHYFDDVNELLSDSSNEFEKINLNYVPEKIFLEVKNEIKKIPDLCVTSSLLDNIEINHKNATKGLGISALCEKLGILQDEVMSIGDGSNDISMLEWAGTSVAMGNAIDEAKFVAKYITDNCEDFGFAKAVEKLIL